ncbi:hypothetical protein Cgig2_013804 [Carnegiea gigantea]|uniref:Uncharacterized protein n=1 Tax=Carnegiea gigantea TaxID=171969 RepID=A0A9Q1K3A1_9CARY|nr:hypothetical protein Cgig2_013804 [Carnegiea gigantea]
MALSVYWYDVVCFVIVGLAILVSIYVLWRKESTGGSREKSLYGSLFISRSRTAEELDRDCRYASAGALPTGYVSSLQLWTSCWDGLHPAWLLGIRLLSFSILAAFLSWDIQQWGLSIFMYYTEWTFCLVMLYFAIGSFMSVHGCWLLHIDRASKEDVKISEFGGHLEENTASKTKRNGCDEGSVELQSYYLQQQASQRAGFWGYLMQTTYQTCAGAVVLTDVVFWGIIVPFLSSTTLHLSLLTGCMHTLNLGCLLIETCVNRLVICAAIPWVSASIFCTLELRVCNISMAYPPLWFHMVGIQILSVTCLWLKYLILAVFLVACYGLYTLVVRAKDSLFSEVFPHSYMRSS